MGLHSRYGIWQIESRQRGFVFKRWLPHIEVDKACCGALSRVPRVFSGSSAKPSDDNIS